MIRESISYFCKIIEYGSRRKSLIVRKTEVNDDVNVSEIAKSTDSVDKVKKLCYRRLIKKTLLQVFAFS